MNLLSTTIQLAEIPADAILWIVIGVVWAAAQIFVKLSRREKRMAKPERQTMQPRRDARPTASHEPVSPNDELRRFLREISGVPAEEQEPPPTPRAAKTPDYAVPPPVPPPRPVPTRQAPSRPAPNRSAPSRTAVTAMSRPAVKTVSKKTVQRAYKPAAHDARRSELGDWKTAVIHREIIGPPRALRPYSPTDF